MLKVIRNLLLKIVNDIDAGNSHASEEEEMKILEFISEFTNKQEKLSKYQAYHYLNISRASFDNYVKEGKIPPGRKQQGFTPKFWYKKDLDKYLENK